MQATLFARPGENEKPKKPRTVKAGALQAFVFKKLNDPSLYDPSINNVEAIVRSLIKSAIEGDTPAAKMLLQMAYQIDKPTETTGQQTSVLPIAWVKPAPPPAGFEMIEDDYKALKISTNDGN
jgi:hypothetical protein